jgi:hypothetical protein
MSSVNVVNVVTPDIMASNGVIHIIDEVILPSKFPIFFPESAHTLCCKSIGIPGICWKPE